MGQPNTGTAQTASLVFNSGYLTVNGIQIGNVSNIVCNNAWTKKEFWTLNSVIKRALRRSNLQQALSCDVEGGMYSALYSVFFSASSVGGSDTTFTVLDGQQTAATVQLVCYENDDTSKYYTVTLTGALMLNHNETLASQEFEKVKVDFDCIQMSMVKSNTTSN